MLSNLDLAESKLILKHTKMTRHNLVAFYCALTCGKNEIYVIGHRKIRSLKSETKFNQFLEENQDLFEVFFADNFLPKVFCSKHHFSLFISTS